VKEEVAATPDATAADATATPAEPEVMKKGKQETDEEGEAAKPEKKEKK
jgi:large subunit ribosomal protein L25